MDSGISSLRDGNRLQRSYYRLALPYYERMEPDVRERAEAIDRFLYTRAGLWAWVGWLCGLGGLTAGLAIGTLMPWLSALGLGAVIWVGVSIGGLSAWLRPETILGRQSRGRLLLVVPGIVLGSLTGFVYGHWTKHGSLDLAVLAARLGEKFSLLAPAVLITGSGLVLLFWTLAHAGRQVNQRRLERRLLLAERDAAARSAAEAQLRLLQAQIQPHFVFNTLATLQHWVDRQDPRAGPLLRELTGFLRRSTEMLGHSSVALADEVQAVRHYLAILQARLGPRLQCSIGIDEALAAQPVPAGLLLTLVENAVEHGIEPRIGGGHLAVQACAVPGGWQLRVEDDGVGLAEPQADGVGLANVRQRLHHHFGARATFSLTARDGGGAVARIDVPGDSSR